jgi:hypothetical protein
MQAGRQGRREGGRRGRPSSLFVTVGDH